MPLTWQACPFGTSQDGSFAKVQKEIAEKMQCDKNRSYIKNS